MIIYFDTSALAKLILEEAESEFIELSFKRADMNFTHPAQGPAGSGLGAPGEA